jgi:hypothetical protein
MVDLSLGAVPASGSPGEVRDLHPHFALLADEKAPSALNPR